MQSSQAQVLLPYRHLTRGVRARAIPNGQDQAILPYGVAPNLRGRNLAPAMLLAEETVVRARLSPNLLDRRDLASPTDKFRQSCSTDGACARNGPSHYRVNSRYSGNETRHAAKNAVAAPDPPSWKSCSSRTSCFRQFDIIPFSPASLAPAARRYRQRGNRARLAHIPRSSTQANRRRYRQRRGQPRRRSLR